MLSVIMLCEQNKMMEGCDSWGMKRHVMQSTMCPFDTWQEFQIVFYFKAYFLKRPWTLSKNNTCYWGHILLSLFEISNHILWPCSQACIFGLRLIWWSFIIWHSMFSVYRENVQDYWKYVLQNFEILRPLCKWVQTC